MRIAKYIMTAFLFVLYSFVLNGQNNAIDSLKRVLQTQKEDTNKVNTLIALGTALNRISDLDNALKYAIQALALSERISFQRGQAKAYNRIASVHQTKGNYAEARNNYLSAAKICEELGDKSNSAYALSRVANSYYTEGDITEAIKISYDALRIYEEIKDKPGIAYACLLLGHFYFVDKNYSESLKVFLTGLKLQEELGSKVYVAYFKLGIGKIDAAQGNYTEALKKYSEVLKIFEEADDMAIAEVNRCMGELFEELGTKNKLNSTDNYSRAHQYYMKNLSYWEDIKDNGSLTTGYYHVGKINIALGNFKMARDYLTKALQLGKEIRSKGDLQDIYKSFSALDSAQGDYRQAFEYHKLYILYRDSISNEETKKQLVRATMQYEFDKKEAAAKLAQLEADNEQKRKRIGQWRVIASLGALILVFLLIMFFQWRNSKHRRKANLLLQQQKEKVETTLSELRSTQSQLIQSEKMASLGELTAGIAHEIQNPLNFVNNFSEVNEELLKELKTEAEKGNLEEVKVIANDIVFNSEKINHHGKRADAIVKGMLQHSRNSSGQKELTDINALADEYLRLAYHGLRAKDKTFNAVTKTDFDSGIGKINIIPQDIGRVILNLINNAFFAVDEKKKQMPPSPKGVQGKIIMDYEPMVTVTTKRLGSPLGDRGKPDSYRVEIRVADNGNGIPQKVLDKIFQPFFTTKPTGQGTGLGLSLSYDIVKAHGGELKVETKEGEGSEFSIQLPI